MTAAQLTLTKFQINSSTAPVAKAGGLAVGQAAGRRPQGRPRMRWVDTVRQDAISLGGQGLAGCGLR